MSANIRRMTSPEAQQFEPIPVDLIDRSPYQPRRVFDPRQLAALTDSLKRQGLAQPIVVRPKGPRFELIAGERRWRAAQQAGWHQIDALIRAYSDAEAAELALVENELRVNLNPIETARAVTRLIERFGHTHEDIAAILGLERSSVTNLLRLLSLDTQVQPLIGEGEGRISVGHAKWLIGLERGQQRVLADRVIRESLSVRQLEKVIKQVTDVHEEVPRKDPNIARLEERLTEQLGQRCTLDWNEKSGGGDLRIRFSSAEELEGFLARVGLKGEGE